MRILYDSSLAEYKTPFGCIKENQKCRISVDVPRDCPVKELYLSVEREDGFYLRLPLFPTDFFGEYDRYSGEFALFERGLYFYCFEVVTSDSRFCLYRLSSHETSVSEGCKWQLTCLPEDYSVPNGIQGRVMYQIFPDRFAKDGECDLSGKLMPYTIHGDVSEPPRKGPDENGVWNNDFYGGNLRGIISKLPYLSGLGVGIIYLNPIFKAHSTHRYDTADYKTVDPMLGNEEDLKKLCSEAKKLGIKVILDGVFSHVGSNSIYFDEYRIFGNGAVSSESSPFREWFDFKNYPNEYTSWWGIKTLPCVKELTPSYVDFIIEGEDSVISHWMRLGVSGFRLDVADELPDEFIRLLRKKVKEINPEGIVIGEVWEDASNKCAYGIRRKYFSGGELDGVMNYPFRKLIIGFVTGEITPCEFVSEVGTICENYPKEALNCCTTFLSTHDTPRIITVLTEELGHENAKRALYAATAMQYFLPGIPCIYYGDEVGMRGGKDPENRGWFTVCDDSMLGFFKELGVLRSSSDALKYGDTEVYPDGDGVVIARKYEGEEKRLRIFGSKDFVIE